MFENENLKPGIHLIITRFFSENCKYASLLYRATKWVDEANGVMIPVIEERKYKAKKNLSLMEKEWKENSEVQRCLDDGERYVNAVESYENSSWLIKTIFGKPNPPEILSRSKYSEISRKKSELQSRIHNPMIDIENSEFVSMMEKLLKELDEKGFRIESDDRTSNGDVDQQKIYLTIPEAVTVVT